MVSLLCFILNDGDFNELDSNPLSFVTFVDFKGEALAEYQSVVVASGFHEAAVMRSVARAPAFIQLESEDKLTGVERVAGFGGDGATLHKG